MGMIATTMRAAWLHAFNRPKEAPGRFWLALKTVSLSEVNRQGSLQSYFRMRACLKCELYDSKWKACGDGKRKLSNGDFAGCLCYMPIKVTIPAATCWLHDQGVTDKGWPETASHG